MARLNLKFWDFIAKKYARDPVANPVAYQKKLDITRQYMNKDMQVAELACGTGSTAIAHAPFVNHIYAHDVSAKMLAIAQDKADAANISNITFTQTKIEDFHPQNSSFDMVMCHSIFHLLVDKELVLANVFSMLKPGGIFISSTTCAANMTIAKLILPVGNFLGLLPFIQFFSPDELLTSFTNAGFHIEQKWQPENSDAIFVVAKKPIE